MPFESAWAKVNRAREHRDSLEEEIKATFEVVENRPRVGTKYDEQSGDHVLYVTYMPNLSRLLERASLLFGDAVHNLRSALDHTAFELALINMRGQIEHPRRVAFPITDSEALWQREAYRVRELHPDDAAIIEWHQPYNDLIRAGQPTGSPTILGRLRDYDDWDKHRLLTIVAVPDAGLTNPHPHALSIWMPSVFGRMSEPGPIPLIVARLGAVIARAKFPDEVRLPDLEMAGYLAGRIHIAEGNLDAVKVIDALDARVTGIVRQFDPE